MKLKGLGVNACIELFRLHALERGQRRCRLITAPCVNCWSGLILPLATEIDFDILTELFGLTMTENGEEKERERDK
jgi:hypothetical protein